jgi:hypothetical protein
MGGGDALIIVVGSPGPVQSKYSATPRKRAGARAGALPAMDKARMHAEPDRRPYPAKTNADATTTPPPEIPALAAPGHCRGWVLTGSVTRRVRLPSSGPTPFKGIGRGQANKALK